MTINWNDRLPAFVQQLGLGSPQMLNFAATTGLRQTSITLPGKLLEQFNTLPILTTRSNVHFTRRVLRILCDSAIYIAADMAPDDIGHYLQQYFSDEDVEYDQLLLTMQGLAANPAMPEPARTVLRFTALLIADTRVDEERSTALLLAYFALIYRAYQALQPIKAGRVLRSTIGRLAAL